MFLGADTESLREMSGKFTAGGERLGELALRIAQAAATVAWVGEDRDRFVDAAGQAGARLAEASKRIVHRSRELDEQAEEQDIASGGDGESPQWEQLVDAAGSLSALIGVLVAEFRSGRLPVASHSSADVSLPGVAGLSPFGGDFEEPDQASDYDVPTEEEIDAVNESLANGLEDWEAADIDQASLSSCWFIATAGSIGVTHPEIIRQNMSWDEASQSWTVTLYDWRGRPQDYTVPADSLINEGVRGPDGEITWLTVYEAAAAQHMGGYGEVENNIAGTGFRMVTGESSDTHVVNPSMENLDERLRGGESVVASTWNGPGFLGGVEDDRLVGSHVYVVDEVLHPGDDGYPEGAEGPQVRVINPWGDGNEDKPHEVILSEEEFDENFMSVNTWQPDTQIMAPGPPGQSDQPPGTVTA